MYDAEKYESNEFAVMAAIQLEYGILSLFGPLGISPRPITAIPSTTSSTSCDTLLVELVTSYHIDNTQVNVESVPCGSLPVALNLADYYNKIQLGGTLEVCFLGSRWVSQLGGGVRARPKFLEILFKMLLFFDKINTLLVLYSSKYASYGYFKLK